MGRLLARCAKRGERVRRYDVRPAARGRLADPPSGRFRSSELILLKADTAIELGPPGHASCSLALATSSPDLVADGRVTHVGPDLPGLRGAHDFALVVMAAGGRLAETDCGELGRALVLSGGVSGFMARSSEGRLWCRVGKEASRGGLGMEEICGSIYRACRARVPAAEAVELVAAVSADWVVHELELVRAQWEEIARTLKKYRRVGQDTYECESQSDCDECPDSQVCDTIKEIIVIRKGNREARLRLGGRGQ